MSQDKVPEYIGQRAIAQVGESPGDYRERVAALQAEAIERRQKELQEQASPLNSAADRILIWERLHQVELPRNPAHRLISVIAAQTGLSADEVLAEQRVRATTSTRAATGEPAL